MPLDVPMHLPFPPRISGDVERARARQLEWPSRYGLLPTERARHRHEQAGYADLAARMQPAATGAELDLSVDQMSWFFLFDDVFDTQLGRSPDDAAALVTIIEGVLDGAAAAPIPVVRAFADLWNRSRVGMTAEWAARAAVSWRTYLRAHVDEARTRLAPGTCTAAERLLVRTETVGTRPVLDLGERLGGFELPLLLAEDAWMVELRALVGEVVALENDVVSFEKELAAGEPNLLELLRHENDTDLDGAVDLVREMVHVRIERFCALTGRLDETCGRLGLGSARARIYTYITDTLVAVLRGAHDWQQQSLRYKPGYLTVRPKVSLGIAQTDGAARERQRKPG